MKKSIISLIIGASLTFTSLSYAETYEKTEYFRDLDKTTIDIQEAKHIETINDPTLDELIELGDFYAYNKQYRDTFKSYDYFKEATIRGSEYAKMILGYFTYKGYGIDPNVYKGEYILKDVKKPYDKNAMFLLGLVFYEDSQYDKSIEIFKKIKDPIGYKYLSKMLIEQRKTEEAVPYLIWLIEEENDREAKRELGEIYLSKNVLNESEGIRLLKESAKDGDDIAQYTLGIYYTKGTKNTTADIHEAVRWLAMSAQHNNRFAIQEILKIWNDNQSNNNIYGLNNDPYLTKIVNDIYTEINLDKINFVE